jgi:hypothetical protein
MALNESQIFQCFQLAGVIWDDFAQAKIHDGFGVQLELTDLDALQSALRTRLTTLSAAAETEVADLVTRWGRVKFNTASMDQGAVGDTTGLKYDPKDKRENLKELFASTLGLMGIYQAQAAKNKAMRGERADSGIIGIRRG